MVSKITFCVKCNPRYLHTYGFSPSSCVSNQVVSKIAFTAKSYPQHLHTYGHITIYNYGFSPMCTSKWDNNYIYMITQIKYSALDSIVLAILIYFAL